MMVLAPAIAFFAVDGFVRGFSPWEKTLLAALWLMPLVARSVAHMSLIPLGVPVMLAVFVLILRRSEFRVATGDVLRRPVKMPSPASTRGHDIAAFKS